MPMIKSALGATLIAAALAGALQSTPDPPAHALTGGRVVGFAGSAAIDDATILIRNGRIAAVGPSGNVQVPRGIRTTSLAGKFVLPGLVSAHAHISDVDGLRPRAYTAANTARQLGVFARYGITTVWSLGGERPPAFEARDAQSVPTLARA